MKKFKFTGILPVLFLVAAITQLSAAPMPAQSQAGVESATNAASSAAASASAPGQSVDLRQGTKISSELMSNVDARKAKVGDQVKARVTRNVKQHGRTLIHKGDTLVGHVTSVESGATKKAGSQMAIAFDELVQGSSTTHLNTVLTSILSANGSASGNAEDDSSLMAMPSAPAPVVTSGGGGGGLLGGVTSTAGSVVGTATGVAGSTLGGVSNTVGNTVGSTVGAASQIGAGNNSSFGLSTPVRNIRLQSSASADQSTGLDSTLSTRHGDLRLASGTQMQFRVAGSASKPSN